MPRKQTQRMRPADLRQHPVQIDYLLPLTDTVLTAKAAVVSESGQQRPVQVLSGGTVVAGWDEVEVAQTLGWEMINAVVRHDLDGDNLEAESLLVNDALANRPLSRLETFALLQRLEGVEWAAWRSSDEIFDQPKSLQELAREWLGIGKREVDRLKRIMELPRSIRLAAAAGYLSVRLAHDLVGLRQDLIVQLVEQIEDRGIESALQVAHTVLPWTASTSDDPEKAYRKLVRALQRAISQLPDHVGEVHDAKHADIEVLREAKKLIAQLHRYVRRSVAQREAESEAWIQKMIEDSRRQLE
jgi:hypothetical protein